MRLDHLLSKEKFRRISKFSALTYKNTRCAKRNEAEEIPKVGRIEIFVETRNVLFVFECTIERLDIHS